MARKLDYRWNLRQVMASRGMFADHRPDRAAGRARDPAVVQPGLPAGHRAARAAEPEGADGAAGHPGLHDGGPDRAGRRGHARPQGEDAPAARKPGSASLRPKRARITGTGELTGGRRHRRTCWPTRSASSSAWSPASSRRWSRAAIEDAVVSVAGGRAKRRRLAQALLDGPAVLADGRSPAPRAVGDLLIALRKAGATVISPPACAGCGKHAAHACSAAARTGTARVCGPGREPCAACGSARAGHLPRPGRAAPLRRSARPATAGTPSPSSPGSSPRSIPALPAEAVVSRGERGGRPGRAAPPAGLGAAGPARAAHRGRRPGARSRRCCG